MLARMLGQPAKGWRLFKLNIKWPGACCADIECTAAVMLAASRRSNDCQNLLDVLARLEFLRNDLSLPLDAPICRGDEDLDAIG